MPSFFDAWLNRANLCLETNDYETAENCLLEALKLKADASVALKLMNLYMMTSQYRKLLIESQSFIKRYSSNTQGYINHSRALASLESTEVALKFLEQAKELVDESAEIEHEIGLINYELGKFDRAKNNLNKAVSQAPEFINAHRTLNELYFQSNDGEFLSSYKHAIQRKPASELLFHIGKPPKNHILLQKM
jgi:tetratricopeptide (TPR) repeat protein